MKLTTKNIIESVQTIYIRVESDINGCATVVPLTLHTNILFTGTNVHNYHICDDESADGIANFDLEFLAEDFINDLENITVTFYETQDDLDNEVNPIDQSNPYESDFEPP